MARQYQLQENNTRTSNIDFAAELNEQQFLAVTSKPGPALVIAGAGSGKTRTLTYRVAYLLSKGVEARNIMLLTFTNKAAKEMTERVSELVTQDTSAMWSGTFHSIGSRILRRSAEEIGYTRSFTILDSDDVKSLLKSVIEEADIDTKAGAGKQRFPKPQVISSVFSLALNTKASIQEIIENNYPHLDFWAEHLEDLFKLYQKRKHTNNSMDFDDLLVNTVDLLQSNPELLKLYQQRFKYLLVDEYQDTNRIQGEMIDLLVREHQSLMVVGDDAQSIYSWRGADMNHILSFPTRYPTAKTFKIETNYRSAPEILELSNQVIEGNQKQFAKHLAAARETIGALPALVPTAHPKIQASFVSQRIQELLEEGTDPQEIAILYRAHYLSLELQMELTAKRIPFQITSGMRFFEQAHTKDAIAYLRFVTNPQDELSFKRIIELLPGIGAKGAEKLWQTWLSTAAEYISDFSTDAPQPVGVILREFKVPKKAQTHWEQLTYTLDEMVVNGKFNPPTELIYSIIEGLYRDYAASAFDNAELRMQDLEQMQNYAAGFDNVIEFLSQLSLLSNVDDQQNQQQERSSKQEDTVTLSSIHQAKGLEWQAVFVIGLADGMFPNQRVLDNDQLDELEEERRLFYVAVTRAKDELYLTYPQMNPNSYTGEIMLSPSRFLEEIDSHLVEAWELEPEW